MSFSAACGAEVDVINAILGANPTHTLVDGNNAPWSDSVTYDTRTQNWNYAKLDEIMTFDSSGNYSYSGRLVNWADTGSGETIVGVDMSGGTLGGALDFTGLANLRELILWGNAITGLTVANNAKLEKLDVWNNDLTSLDVSSNTQLRFLDAGMNALTSMFLKTRSCSIWVSAATTCPGPDLMYRQIRNSSDCLLKTPNYR